MLIGRPTLEVIHVDREVNIRGNSCMLSYNETNIRGNSCVLSYKWSLLFYKK